MVTFIKNSDANWFSRHFNVTYLMVWLTLILGFYLVSLIPARFQNYIGLTWLLAWGLIVTFVERWMVRIIRKRQSRPPWFLRSWIYIDKFGLEYAYKIWVVGVLVLMITLIVLMLVDIFTGGRIRFL